MAKKRAPRRSLSAAQREVVRKKTGGRCHVCGGPLASNWKADHVRPLARGGSNDVENYLPVCRICNSARWFRTPKKIRYVLRLGVYGYGEVLAGTKLGRKLEALYKQRHDRSRARRKAR